MVNNYTWSVGGRFMDTIVATILVCGVLNLIPWFLLAFFRPDRSIYDQIQNTDEGLAMVAKVILDRIESLENLADSAMNQVPENPLAAIVTQLFQNRLAANDDYMRAPDGTFNGPPEIIEAQSPPNDSN
jgi:ABC-type phosphate transport system auxiliary subunit